ncbi:3-isopropylmalate dehydratase small subunit [Salimicrobium halophilum]|uniref:3-isopropylmalate dehydratase small subunit n=1 Tax=Salimicrobium halophilum TaxID=86666 RepID=A0A1G8RL83_9BACI|nr:3-isopropylmalate dehydratase small subunit [Salimicrobium halophilum]SDJ17706.1 3-isopropylmalate/(R)-2-methylmalate dehydratase small subunit [Salimicrobium halophilum]
MEAFVKHTGLVYPLNRSNIDTDQIIPKQFLKRIERKGFGKFLFYNWRYDDDGNLREDFSLNYPEYDNASIMVAGENFGCGSSREHAPWAIQDYGFRVVIAPSFADIFYSNCFKNGILPVPLAEEEVQQIIEHAEKEQYHITVDLESQEVYAEDGWSASFEISEYHKNMLLNGWDEISVTLTYEDAITAFEQNKA